MFGDKGIRKVCKRYDTPGDAHELTFSCFKRRAFLGRDTTRAFFAEAIRLAAWKHRFDLWAYVLMPEHVHLILWPREQVYAISRILLTVKQSVARRSLQHLRKRNPGGLRWLATGQRHTPYRFWQDGGGYDRNIRSAATLLKAVAYIHNNPVRRGLVVRPEEWVWSSFQDWEGLGHGPIPVNKESALDQFR